MNTNKNLSTWNTGFGPLGDMRRDMSRFLEDFLSFQTDDQWRGHESQWKPACDVEETDDHYLVTFDMPGIPKEHIKLEVVDSQLVVSGERVHEHKQKENGAWYSERRFGKFHRSFSLPVGVDTEKVEADYKDGILRVYVPKAESSKPRQIKISGGSAPGFFGKLIGQAAANEEKSA